MEELWKDVVGYEDFYMVSNLGRVFRKEREIKHNMVDTITLKEKMLSSYKAHTGYLTVEFMINRKKKNKLVHRLVAEAFLPNYENKPYINHIDGNKANPVLTNLEWCTNSENQLHAYEIGLQPSRKGENQSNSILKDKDIHLIVEMLDNGIKGVDIAKTFNVNKSVISKIKNGKSWNHITGINTAVVKE